MQIVDLPYDEGTNKISWSDLARAAGIDDILDRIHLSSRPYELTIYCDENGFLKDLPINFFIGRDPVLGNVVIARAEMIRDDLFYYSVTYDDMFYFRCLLEIGDLL